MTTTHPTAPARSHPHGHDHHAGHAHGGHDHAHDHHAHMAAVSHRRLALALAVTLVAMLISVVGGLMARSLALVADAGHMLADVGALGLSLIAARQALRPADATHSFGHARRPVLAAFLNGALLLLASAWIAFEAVQRLLDPQPVDGHTMVWVAIVGLVANVVSYGLLHGGDVEDLNRRGAAAHVLSDLLGSVAALIAGVVILYTGWLRADPLFSLVAAGLVLRIGIKITRESAHILLEGTPRGMDLDRLVAELSKAVPGVASVHHLHAWSLSQTQRLVTLHAVPEAGTPPETVIAGLKAALARHGVTHLTVQIEPGACQEPDCGNPATRPDLKLNERVPDFEPAHAHGHAHAQSPPHAH